MSILHTFSGLAALYSCVLVHCSALDVEDTSSELELKAVFINCDPHDIQEEAEAAARRVQREELYKHGKFDGCLKKIGITVKLSSHPAMAEGEEYIPVEHVAEGGAARARLLNPYVLRLRRDAPVQAYPLTLRGSVTVLKQEDNNEEGIRQQRDIVLKEGDEWAKGLAYMKQWMNNFTKSANNNKSESLNIITDRLNNSCNADGFEKWQRRKRFDDNTENTMDTPNFHKPNVLSIVNRSKAKRIPAIEEEGIGVISIDNKKFTLYDIGEPAVWHTVRVQLFERDTDGDGETVWNDVAKGDIASVGPQKPEFESENLAVHYRSLEWLDRDKFTLPKKPLCLLESKENEPSAGDNSVLYLIVPAEDVSGMNTIVKRNSNDSKGFDDIADYQASPVTVRISRAWAGSHGDDMTVTSQDGGSFLTLPLAAPLRAQVDLEARADGNQLVYVGTAGRISVAVADGARRARSTISLHATNTGLAAARFTAIAKDCSAEVSALLQQNLGSEVVTTDSQLIPPRHTRRYNLVLPIELPAEKSRCSVCLLNHKNESVAIREVALKKGDRCFCVWHCDCVCLTDDPKLLCRALPAPLLSAGGVPHARPRARKREPPPCQPSQPGCLMAVCGAVASILGLGLLKGIIGIFCLRVAYYKLDAVCSLPRPLNKYQEPWLRSRPVRLDAAGYAVHPDTGLRTVHSMPILTMLMMNTILIPAIAFQYLDRCIRYCVKPPGKTGSMMLQPAYNTMDMQTSSLESKKRRRPRCVQRWMSPHAEQLSEELWTRARDPHDDSIGPQLFESFGRKYDVAQSSVDSEAEEPEPQGTDSVTKQQEPGLDAADDEAAEGRSSETQTCLPMRPGTASKERRWRRRAPQAPLCVIS